MIIYIIKNKINGKMYIGKTTKNLEERKKEHLSSKFEYTHSLIHRAIEKYGSDNFDFSILKECSSSEELNESEIFFIKEFDSIKKGYNIGSGGDGGDNISNHPNNKKIREKISQSSKKIWTDERRKKHSELMSGENNPNYKNNYGFNIGHVPINSGKTFEETYGEEKALDIREKISKGNLGTKKPGTSKAMKENNPSWRQDVKEKIGKANKGRVFSEEIRRKMSDAQKGKILSEEHRLNIGKASSGSGNGRYIHVGDDVLKEIIYLYNNGYNLTDLSNKYNLTTRKISSLLKENSVEVKRSRPSKL